MSDNRYGNLLDKYMDGSKKYTSPLLSKEEQKYKAEGESRYGDLLKNAKENDKLYEDIINASNAGLMVRSERARWV